MAAFRIAALLGFAAGAAVGALPWQRTWPGISILGAWKGAALGWLLGAALSVPVGWALSRRAGAGGTRSRWRRAVGLVTFGIALAPAALWLSMATPGGLLRRSMESGRARGETRPDLILITVEALRPDHLGAYGSTAGLTPNLDAFARGATRYDAAYASGPWTVPSLAALFTSLPPSQSAIGLAPNGNPDELAYFLAGDVAVLPEKLRNAGYATAAELTNHFLSPERGWDRGFDCFRNESTDMLPFSEATYGANVTAKTAEWMGLNRREPFFLWVHYFDPHVPYDAPDTPASLRAQYPRSWVADRRSWTMMPFGSEALRARFMEFCRAMYAEEVRYADRWVGELLERIRTAGVYDRSLIVITADHGEELFDRTDDGGMEHGHSMHEPVLWVPLLVKWPQGVEADARVTQTVGLAELHATMLELAGIRGKSGGEGEGLPRRDGARGTEVFSEWILYGKEQTALTTDDYRVIYHPEEKVAGRRFEVYDRRTDRQERHNLAGTEAAADLRARLRRLTQEALETRARSARERAPRRVKMSEKEKRDLRALGYIGN